jgi:hypothetical protein
MNILKNQRKGQVFSIDVLFSLLPVIMILGASLQYLYLAEEDLKMVVGDSEREAAAQAMGDYLMAMHFDAHAVFDCGRMRGDLNTYNNSFLKVIPGKNEYRHYATGWDYTNGSSGDYICSGQFLPHFADIKQTNNTASAQERFMLSEPGKIVGVSVTVFEDIP